MPLFNDKVACQSYDGSVRWLLFAVGCACWAQPAGTAPKPKAEDYEIHDLAGKTGVGVEYMVHSFSAGEQAYLARDFLVVEVALYPPQDADVHVQTADFKLAVNGKNLTAVPPQAVATQLSRPEYRQGPHLEGGAGLGNTGVVLGRPAPTQMPGQPPVTGPRPPRVDTTPGGVERQEPEKAEDVLLRTALPEGDFPGPVSGYLYFPYRGKSTSVKSVVLVCYGLRLKLK